MMTTAAATERLALCLLVLLAGAATGRAAPSPPPPSPPAAQTCNYRDAAFQPCPVGQYRADCDAAIRQQAVSGSGAAAGGMACAACDDPPPGMYFTSDGGTRNACMFAPCRLCSAEGAVACSMPRSPSESPGPIEWSGHGRPRLLLGASAYLDPFVICFLTTRGQIACCSLLHVPETK